MADSDIQVGDGGLRINDNMYQIALLGGGEEWKRSMLFFLYGLYLCLIYRLHSYSYETHSTALDLKSSLLIGERAAVQSAFSSLGAFVIVGRGCILSMGETDLREETGFFFEYGCDGDRGGMLVGSPGHELVARARRTLGIFFDICTSRSSAFNDTGRVASAETELGRGEDREMKRFQLS